MPTDLSLILAETAAIAGDATGLFTVASLIALITLTALEIVLGIDNVVFIAILADNLPEKQRKLARRVGLLLAMVARIALLFAIAWLMGLKSVLFEIPFMTEPHPTPEQLEAASGGAVALGVSGKDLILLAGGLFLVAKAAWEIRHQVEHTLLEPECLSNPPRIDGANVP